MVVSLVNLAQRNAFDRFAVSWMDIVRVALHFAIQVAGFFLMAVGRENLSKSVSHLHFAIESPSHVPVWGESALIQLKLGHWGLSVVLSVIWWECLPLFLNC